MAKKQDDIVQLKGEFPSNSKSRKSAPVRPVEIIEEGANIETVTPERKPVKARAMRRKKTLGRSIAQTFFGEEAKNVGSYILFDVLIPAAKSTIQEMVTRGVEMFLFGGEGEGRSHRRDRGETRISYANMYKRREEGRESMRSPKRDRFGLEDIYFRDASDATTVLESLCEELEKYEVVTVATFLDLANIDNENGWAANKWGWDDLRRARCIHTRYGWAITLPDPVELD